MRDEALSRVLQHRERGRRRPAPARAVMAAAGVVLLLVSVPLLVVLPEGGIPALLLALRLLAVELDWAARAYAWFDWRFSQARAWYRRQSLPRRLALVAAGVVVLALLVWLLVRELV